MRAKKKCKERFRLAQDKEDVPAKEVQKGAVKFPSAKAFGKGKRKRDVGKPWNAKASIGKGGGQRTGANQIKVDWARAEQVGQTDEVIGLPLPESRGPAGRGRGSTEPAWKVRLEQV